MINQEVAHQLTKARTQLVLDHPFWGLMALRLLLVETSTIPTAAVDGKRMLYNPTFIAKLDAPKIKTLVAHEVGHCMWDHIGRRGDRNPKKWNMAGDYVINAMLVDSGFEPIGDWLYNKAYDGMSADHIYSLIPDDDAGGPAEGGDYGGPGQPLDNIMDGDPNEVESSAMDWKIATIQAANAAKQMGKLPAAMERFIDELTTVKIDWRAVLRRFVTERSKDDYSWSRPNRRFLSSGIYLPSLYSESMGEIAVVIDTSGSIDQVTLNAFGAEIKAIVQSARPIKTHVIYCDREVNHIDEFSPNDDLQFKMHGGGGTDFRPPFAYVDAHGIKPVCLVYLTDGYGPFPDSADYPVLWVCTTDVVAPFGETVPIEL
jgi:predicted metal-dependent peptidase